MNLSPPLDIQSAGWKDLGDGQGGLVGLPAYGPLVEVPFHTVSNNSIWSTYGAGWWERETGGAPSVTSFARPLGNTDGSSSSVTVILPAADASFVRFRNRIWGRRFGLRWEWQSGRTSAPFQVIIDGQVYSVSPNQSRDYVSGVERAHRVSMARWICPDILSDVCHDVEILLHADQTGGSSRTYVLTGVLLDSNYGYHRPDPMVGLFGPYEATDAWTVFNPSAGLASWDIINVRFTKIIAYNKSVSTASVYYGQGASDLNMFYRKEITTLQQDIFDLGAVPLFMPRLGIKASVASAIDVWVFAGGA